MRFNQGVISSKDASLISLNSLAEGVNISIEKNGMPVKCLGQQKYNTTAMGTTKPVKGGITFIGEDGTEYMIIACNNSLYYTTGEGTFTAIKYTNENVAVTIDTANQWFNFILFDQVQSGTAKKVIYCITNVYPVSTTANGTNNKYCTISKALKLQIAAGVIIALNVYYDTDSTRTAGSDDVEVGQGSSQISWPQSGRYSSVIFDRIFISNYSGATNGWICSEAQDSEDWTNTSAASNTGGGKNPEDFTGQITYGTSILFFTRHGIMNLQCVPGPIASYREFWLKTDLGNVGNQVCIHSDGWVYFISEQGIARTDGRIAEIASLDIEDALTLAQLQKNAYSNTLTATGDWNAGTPSSGDQLFDTASGLLTKLPQNTQGQWDNGTKSNVDTNFLTNQVTPTDLAQAATKSASSTNSSFPIANAFDRNNSTEWQSSGTGIQWIKIDLGSSPTGIAYVYCKQNAVQVQAAILQGSNNDTDWDDIYTSAGGNEYINRMILVSSGYRYLRVAFAAATTVSQVFSFAFYDYANTSFITQALDFGATPSTYGNLVSYARGASPGIYPIVNLASSADNVTYTSYSTDTTNIGSTVGVLVNLSTIVANISATPAIQRYVKLKITFGAAAGNVTEVPWVCGVASLQLGAQWVSATQDLTAAPAAWGTFLTESITSGQTITYATASSANADFSSPTSYANIINGQVPTIALNRYLRYRITFNTNNYAQLPYVDYVTQNYFLGSASAQVPVIASFKDRLYASFKSNNGTYNDHCWIGETKPTLFVEYQRSPISGAILPNWFKRDFINANIFLFYRGRQAGSTLISGGSQEGFIDYQETGSDNRGSAFTSYFVTKSIFAEDTQVLLRYFYIYCKSNSTWSFYYATRNEQNVWSAYSTALTIPVSSFISRIAKKTPSTLALGDFLRFKFETTSTDEIWGIKSINLYVDTKPIGRN